MTQSEFEVEARVVVARNLTANVAGVSASVDLTSGHLSLVYFLFGSPTEDDEEFRELSVAELVAAFPAIRTAAASFGLSTDLGRTENHVVFARG